MHCSNITMEMEELANSEMGCSRSDPLTDIHGSHETVPAIESPPPYNMSNVCFSNYQPGPPAYPQQTNSVSLFCIIVCVCF